MMAGRYQAPKGTYDLLPDKAAARSRVVETAREILERAGYGQIDTPIFEETELFSRSVGDATDIVAKEMYTFEDRSDRSMTLRPEGTAPICRAYIEHGMQKWPQPVKLWYTGPMFRYEAPQSGRYRQHLQVGVEAFGSDDPSQDAELIVLQADLCKELGVETNLALSSMGDGECRPAYIETLREYLIDQDEAFSKEQLERIKKNPLRAFDWQEGKARDATDAAPKLLDHLCDHCRDHFQQVCKYLDAVGIDYELDPRLVRGLDYYTGTVFEFSSEKLGAQSGVGGGGRYDALVEELGGPSTPAAGWGLGVDRVVLALEASGEAVGSEQAVDVFCAVENTESAEARIKAFELTNELRQRGINTSSDTSGRSLKSQLKMADRLGASFTACVDSADAGDTGWLRDMRNGTQQDGIAFDQLAKAIEQGLEREFRSEVKSAGGDS